MDASEQSEHRELTVREAGRLGGRKTFENHGHEFYKKIGRNGGSTVRSQKDLLEERLARWARMAAMTPEEHRERVRKALAESPQKRAGRPLRVRGTPPQRDDQGRLLSAPEETEEPIPPPAEEEDCE